MTGRLKALGNVEPSVTGCLLTIVASLFLLIIGADVVFAQGGGTLLGQAAQVAPPQLYVPQFSAAPAAPSAAQIAASEAYMARSEARWAARTLPISAAPVAGPALGTDTAGAGPAPQAPGTFTKFRASKLGPSTGSSNINEPSVAQAGQNVVYTGNWYAARSTDAGATWSYVNPYADFADFCCDQDVVYDKGRDIFLWFRQGVVPFSGTQNVFKLGVSGNGGASFCTYTVAPTNVSGVFTNREFDYPHLALSNNFLYISTNMFFTGGDFDQMLLLRWPLDALATCSGFSYSFWGASTGWTWTPVENGVTTQMYLGDHVDTSTFRVYRQPESSTTLFWVDRTIDAWTFTNRDGSCPVLGGRNPCLRADQRVLSGWVRSLGDGQEGEREIGFFWNVKEGGGFPFPYVNAAVFRERDQVYTGQPLIWNENYAWHYAAAAPNRRGDLGIGVFLFASNANPQYWIGVDDDYNGAPPGWEVYLAKASSGAPSGDSWGDYIRVRLLDPVGVGWVGTGYFRKFNGVTTKSKPYFVIFGRERDTEGILRSMNAP